MSGSLHMDGQTTKKYNLPLSHLDYKYIETCKNPKEIEKIINVLRSGDEGKFPDLERFAEHRLQELNPKSRSLRKDGPILRPGDLSGGDWKSIEEDLKNWTNTMHDQEPIKSQKHSRPVDDIVEGDENLPPIRSGNLVLEGKKQKREEKQQKKRVIPRNYKEWDKVDIDAELEKVDTAETEKKSTAKKDVHITPQIDKTGLTEEEKERKANREKDKGNEAFRSHDFEESVAYYSRSISLMPNAASFNNRALAYLKLECWDKAVKDCNKVLSFEADNIKALLRRGTAFKSKHDFKKAVTDFERVLKMEPNNKKAEALLSEVEKEMEKEEKTRQEKGGRRMVIEEVESEEEDVEPIEVEKPFVNGHGRQEKQVGEAVQGSSEATKSSQANNPTQDQERPNVYASGSKTPADSSTDTQSKCSLLDSIPPSLPAACNKDSAGPSALSSQSAEQSLLLPSSPPSSPPTPARSSAEAERPYTTIPSQELLQEPGKKELASAQDYSTNQRTPQLNSEKEMDVSREPTTEAPSEPIDHFSRPRFIQRYLPPEVQRLKEEGNQLFRSGQYADAIQHYSKAVSRLKKDAEQKVNISILLSNRAACHLKTGNCTEAVKDCQLSLQNVPHSLKSVLRRAAAYEAMERYADAYVDYKHAISIDKLAEQAQQGASRCQSSLQALHGPKSWREKISPLVLVQPWEIPLIEDETGTPVPTAPSQTPSQKAPNDKTSAMPVTETGSSQHSTITPSALPSQFELNTPTASQSSVPEYRLPSHKPAQDFEEVKAKGNQFVQKGHYAEAIKCYNTCISLKPDQVACYTNRALCFLKLHKASEAVNDCEKALQLEPKNPKALYRRALSRKLLLQYKLSLQDLVELLKLEPRNTAAQREMDAVKTIYKEELEKMKQKKAAEQETKVRKRMKIEEVDDDEDEERPTRVKGSEKSKFQNKLRTASGGKSKFNNGRAVGSGCSGGTGPTGPTASQDPASCSHQDQPVAPPIAPRLMKTTPYEFCQAWNSLRPCQGVQPYAEILRQLAPIDLPAVISNKLDGQMLQIIVKCVHEEMVLKGENDRGYEILNHLCEVPRFSTVAMFMSGKEKKEVSSVLAILSKTSSSAYTSADIARLKVKYSVK